MREWVVVIALVVGCKSKDKPAPKVPLVAPAVAVATVLAQDDARPPFMYLVDDEGNVRLAAAATWADLDTNKLKISKQAAPLHALDRFVREQVALGRTSVDSIAHWDELSTSDVDLTSLDDIDTAKLDRDDPPPPEEEEPEAAEESGGTGTAMNLDEAELGKRAAGQYKMKKNQDDPQLARKRAIDHARAAGILDGDRGDGKGYGPGFGGNEDGTPARVAVAAGVITTGKLERLRAMVLVSPTLKATQLIDIVRDTQSAIAVSHASKVRPLRLDFGVRDGIPLESPQWLEVRVSAKGMVVEAVPDKPIEIADVGELPAALERARKARGADASAPVDVLVEADIASQRLVDVLVALDTAGVRAIGIGTTPIPEELARRGRRMPRAVLGQPSAQGDLDKALIRRVVKMNAPQLTACYTKALAGNPDLAGIVTIQFFIAPTGKVASSAVSGFDPQVAACVDGVIKALEFPPPQGGGGVQVSYPVSFRP